MLGSTAPGVTDAMAIVRSPGVRPSALSRSTICWLTEAGLAREIGTFELGFAQRLAPDCRWHHGPQVRDARKAAAGAGVEPSERGPLDEGDDGATVADGGATVADNGAVAGGAVGACVGPADGERRGRRDHGRVPAGCDNEPEQAREQDAIAMTGHERRNLGKACGAPICLKPLDLTGDPGPPDGSYPAAASASATGRGRSDPSGWSGPQVRRPPVPAPSRTTSEGTSNERSRNVSMRTPGGDAVADLLDLAAARRATGDGQARRTCRPGSPRPW